MLITWFIYLPCCPCQGANTYQVAHHKVPMLPSHPSQHGNLPIARCHRLPRMPNAWYIHVASCPSQGPIVCLCFPSHVSHVSKIAHRNEPLCAYGSHSKVSSGAKLPTARGHRVPRMSIAWCIRVPSCPRQGSIVCLYFPSQGTIVCPCCPSVCATMCQGRLSYGSPVCQAGCLHLPRWPS